MRNCARSANGYLRQAHRRTTQQARKLRQAETELWFLESNEYNTWKNSATSPFWLYGIPGCGKTILNSNILQNVLQHCQDDPGKVAVYFFSSTSMANRRRTQRKCSVRCSVNSHSSASESLQVSRTCFLRARAESGNRQQMGFWRHCGE